MKSVLVAVWIAKGLLIDPTPMIWSQEFDDYNACLRARLNIGPIGGVKLVCVPRSSVPAAPDKPTRRQT